MGATKKGNSLQLSSKIDLSPNSVEGIPKMGTYTHNPHIGNISGTTLTIRSDIVDSTVQYTLGRPGSMARFHHSEKDEGEHRGRVGLHCGIVAIAVALQRSGGGGMGALAQQRLCLPQSRARVVAVQVVEGRRRGKGEEGTEGGEKSCTDG